MSNATEVCRNCATPLAGRWCHACGQDSRDPLRDFPLLIGEFLDGVLGWDSRLGRTLRLLVGSPGALTAEFVAGRRARYLGPLRLYLIASVAFFACYTLTPDPVLATIAGSGDWRLGLVRIDYIARWLPTLMILILPSFALIMQLLLLAQRRAFLEHLVFVLHFGAFAFFSISSGQLLALALRTVGVDANWAASAVYAAHLGNSVHLFVAFRRHYGLSSLGAVVRLLAFCVLMTLLLGGAAAGVQALIERYG